MATSTTNLGLIKPSGTDKIRIAQINGNMDIIDEKVGAVGNTSLQTQVTGLGVNLTGLEDCVGIVVDGAKSAVAAAAGQYIVLKNSIISGCDDGLYTAAQAIPADTTIDSTYLTAVSGGGLNALNTQIAQENIKSNLTLGSNVSANSQIYKQGKFIYVALSLTSLTNGDILVSNLGSYKPVYTGIGSVFKSSDGSTVSGSIWAESSTGKITYYGSNASFNCASQFVYMCI